MSRTAETADPVRAAVGAARVIPVLTIAKVEDAVPLARALVAGGVRVLEVTLRTDAAVDAARAIMAEVPDAVVGLGTLTRPADFAIATRIGAAFTVSPGLTPALATAARDSGIPYLPGVATVSEVIAAREFGFNTLKFFPAEVAGGAAALKSFAPLFANLRFCPTGGVTPEKAPAYLSLPNVFCVGGTWLTPAALVEAGDWGAITELARQASAL